MPPALPKLARLLCADVPISSLALAAMASIPLVEMALRPVFGRGIDNAPVLVQHLGLVMAMFGAVAAERHGHLSTLGEGLAGVGGERWRRAVRVFAQGSAAMVCGMLAVASGRLVEAEREAAQTLAYGVPLWWVQAVLPVAFALLGGRLAARCSQGQMVRIALALVLPLTGATVAAQFDGTAIPLWPGALWMVAVLLAGAPVFAVLGGVGLALFWQDGLPLAALPLSHYQITVHSSLPALPLFTLAGLLYARTGAAQRLGDLFVAALGAGVRGTVVATALLCSCFTAFTGGSGVTILALGGLLLPLLSKAGYPEKRGIGLVTSASALGVLLAPSVPLIMYAIIARVPINTMFLAGVLPALLMVAFLLIVGGFLRHDRRSPSNRDAPTPLSGGFGAALWKAKWEVLAPIVAMGSLLSGWATPTETAAVTAAYALATQTFAHREMSAGLLARCLAECAQIIGGVMLILGMALGLTNYLVDAGIPDAAITWVQELIPNKYLFLLALNVALLLAGALMEIFAAIVFLVPLLLPVALSYGIDPVHFGIIFLANLEMGFLCPPAGMNLYFASAMFKKPIRYVAAAVVPAVIAIFIGTLFISWLPIVATGLPRWVLGG